MKILIADDDIVTCVRLQGLLGVQGYEVVAVPDGPAAWAALHAPDPPLIAILDWMMPAPDGLEICRRIRAETPPRPLYLMLLTGRDNQDDLIAGLEAGANDYLTKPFDPIELRARVRVAAHQVALQQALAERVRELEVALAQVNRLRGLLPICMYCKKVRTDQGYWEQVESYLVQHEGARLSHGICPDCYDSVVVPMLGQAAPP